MVLQRAALFFLDEISLDEIFLDPEGSGETTSPGWIPDEGKPERSGQETE